MEGKTLESNARRPRRLKDLGRIMLLLLGAGLATMATATASHAPLKHNVQLGSYRVERDVTPGRNKVVGTLTNVSHSPIHATRVSFRLLDARGRVVGHAVDEVHDLQPGQTWKFHALARGNVSRARLLRVETR